MFILLLLEALFAFVLLWFLITQIAVPVFRGGKLFPLFKMSPLRAEVEATKETVNDLKDQNSDLATLAALKKKRMELEAQISRLNSVVETTETIDKSNQQTTGVK